MPNGAKSRTAAEGGTPSLVPLRAVPFSPFAPLRLSSLFGISRRSASRAVRHFAPFRAGRAVGI